MKDKIFGVLQRVGRSFMLPIAMLPIAIITSRILWKKGVITVEDNPAVAKKEK